MSGISSLGSSKGGSARKFGKWILYGILGLAFIGVIGPLMTFAGELGNTGESVVNTGTSIVKQINGELDNISTE